MATESVSQTSTAAQEWKRRWPLVLAAVVGFSFHSVMTAFAGLFIGPVGEEFGWSRTQVTAGLSLSSVTVTILSPFFGVLIQVEPFDYKPGPAE